MLAVLILFLQLWLKAVKVHRPLLRGLIPATAEVMVAREVAAAHLIIAVAVAAVLEVIQLLAVLEEYTGEVTALMALAVAVAAVEVVRVQEPQVLAGV
jgi:hypothetical protein